MPSNKCLYVLFQGLRETVHPYMFVARTGFKEMLEVPNCANLVVPHLPKLTVAIRSALVSYSTAWHEHFSCWHTVLLMVQKKGSATTCCISIHLVFYYWKFLYVLQRSWLFIPPANKVWGAGVFRNHPVLSVHPFIFLITAASLKRMSWYWYWWNFTQV